MVKPELLALLDLIRQLGEMKPGEDREVSFGDRKPIKVHRVGGLHQASSPMFYILGVRANGGGYDLVRGAEATACGIFYILHKD